MYLARIFNEGRPEFALRHSVRGEDGVWAYRTIMNLGADPASHIRYPGGNAFYIDDGVGDALLDAGVEPDTSELEDLFWDFVKPAIRHCVGHFDRRKSSPTRKATLGGPPPGHRFDHRRMLFLRSGGLDQSGLARVPNRFFHRLVDKSRDEREQLFLAMERQLKPKDVKTYIYVAFDLQRFFDSPIATRFPGAMDPERLDQGFLETACALHADRQFWKGHPAASGLDPYLIRYITVFFDTDFPREDPMGDYAHDFMNRHRHERVRKAVPPMPTTDAAAALGLTVAEVNQMDRSALARRYRKLALKHHPDQGGAPEAFVRTTEAFRSLLKRKKSKDSG